MSFVKALLCGVLLSWIVASVLGAQHTRGGILYVFNAAHSNPLIPNSVETFYWSWPLFVGGTALAWALFWMQES
jgi:hypothetical protein